MKPIITTILGLSVLLTMDRRDTFSQQYPVKVVNDIPIARPQQSKDMDRLIDSELDSVMKAFEELKTVSKNSEQVIKRGKKLSKILDTNYSRIKKFKVLEVKKREVKPLSINLGPIQPIRSIKLTIDSSKAVNLPDICTEIPKKKNIFNRIFR